MRITYHALLAMLLLGGCGSPDSATSATTAPSAAPAADAPAATAEADAAAPAADSAAATEADGADGGMALAPPTALTEAWKGDLDGMIERRVIRALVPYSKTMYFIDGGDQRGIAYEYMKAFEDDLNARRKTGNLRVHVLFIPTARDRMLEMLDAGRGDIAAVDATISEAGQALADYTTPIASGVKEIVVTGPGSPAIATLDDLAGKTVYVRKASTREANLRALSDKLVARGLTAIDVRTAPNELEPEDLLEMTNAGLLPAVVVNH